MQLKDTIYLNQYKSGSKLLSSCAQNYAITGNDKYYERYFNELNVDKNRETALEGLKRDGLEESELEALRRILDLSEQLVPIEKESMAEAKNKNMLQARKDRLVEGRFGACTDLIPDDSEMGKMIADIIRFQMFPYLCQSLHTVLNIMNRKRKKLSK